MKKQYLLTSAVVFALILNTFTATAQCDGKRYKTKIFDTVRVVKDIQYGSNFTYDASAGEAGLTQEALFLDVYMPPDTNASLKRPLIIFAHGGSFINGTKEDADIVYFCNEFAKRGYVTASIQYRLGYEQPLDSINATRAVYRALQDGRAAVRFMRSNAQEFQVDPDKIFFGGTSAGAFVAINIAYLNLPKEVPSYVDTSAHSTFNYKGLDGIEGKTNSIEAASTISGIINFCGATKTNTWMEDTYSRSIPIISMHGTDDQTVPYGRDFVYINRLLGAPQPDVPLILVDGSFPIHQKANELGIPNAFYTWCGAPHVPYIGTDAESMAYMDTLISFTNKGIYEKFLNCGFTAGYETNSSECSGLAGVNDFENAVSLTVYPNPVQNELFIDTDIAGNYAVSVYNLAGQKMLELNNAAGQQIKMNTTSLSKGSYFVRVQNNTGTSFSKFIKN